MAMAVDMKNHSVGYRDSPLGADGALSNVQGPPQDWTGGISTTGLALAQRLVDWIAGNLVESREGEAVPGETYASSSEPEPQACKQPGCPPLALCLYLSLDRSVCRPPP